MALRESLRAAFGVERVAAWAIAMVAVAAVVVVTVSGVPTAGAPTDATFDRSYDEQSQSYTITYEGEQAISNGESITVAVSGGRHTANVTWVGDDGVTDFPLRPGDSITIDDPRVDSDRNNDYFDGDATVGFEFLGDEEILIRWTGRPIGAPDTRTVGLDSPYLSE